jgi:hypothetical protein
MYGVREQDRDALLRCSMCATSTATMRCAAPTTRARSMTSRDGKFPRRFFSS